ncbi:uncharacterized protein LOC125027253 isoform X2 [Penaeus chinensis]|uniref:uncharacterized protein LOC125027253 isoform X2 n=1 Tax=Penaeus chinensis TaxID=139456 RepID=UPI001FB69B91|nr:uncharacterized protein LOC125027253 isoform X2 [Penaeus chinensis]
MFPRKRQDKDVAHEGWNERQENLEHFLPTSPQQALSQFNDIEWSSSDEEDQNKIDKSKSTPRLLFLKNRAYDRSQIHESDIFSCEEPSLPFKIKKKEKTFTAEHKLKVSSSPRIGRRCADVNSTDNGSRFHELSFSNKVSQERNRIPEIDNRNLEKTPKKSMCGHKSSNLSPLVGSQRYPSREIPPQAPKEDEISCSMYITEPSSPILGSQTIVKRRRISLGPRSYSSIQQSTCETLESSGHPNSNINNFEISPSLRIVATFDHRNLGESECDKKTRSFKLAHEDKLNFENIDKNKDLEKEILHQSSGKYTQNTNDYSVPAHNIKKSEQKTTIKREQAITYTTKSMFKLKEYKDAEQCILKKTAIHMQNSHSQEINSDTEKSNDNFELDISPFSPVQSGQEGLLESLESCNITISEASSALTEVEETTVQSHKTGSEWLRSLQQITPVKHCLKGSKEEGEDSAKKKLKKDGLASRLSQLIRSWQSSVQMWTHQMALAKPQGPLGNNEQKDNHMTRLPQEMSKNILGGSPSLTNCAQIHFQSPAVKNLSEILGSPSQTSTQASCFSQTHVENSKKNLRLIIIRTGGDLPNNAAECKEHKGQLSQKTMDVIEKGCEFRKKGKNENARKFLVIFALSGENKKQRLFVNNIVKVYAPWQHLVIPQYPVPILFASYFTVEINLHSVNDLNTRTDYLAANIINTMEDKIYSGDGKKSKKKIVLSSWSCACLSGPVGLPSICNSFQYTTVQPVRRITQHCFSEDNPGFSIIKETSDVSESKEGDCTANSVLKAIEKCGGVSDMPVTITIRIHRIILQKNDEGILDYWECVGQDASGMFCSIRIPNHPLVSQFKGLIETGEGATFTFSHVTVLQRLTNTQNSGLFSLLSSLHSSYQSVIYACSDLLSLLKEHATRPPQTYCYVFAVNLRVSKAINNEYQVALPIKLPDWTLIEAMQISHDGCRGNIEMHILYRVESLLYVMNSEGFTEENDKEIKKNHEGHIKYEMGNTSTLVISVLVEKGTSLPLWIPESGTVMQGVVLRDAVIWQALHRILKPLSLTSQSWDLAIVNGTILRIDEESAYSWPACPYCLNSSIIDADNGVECQKCGQKFSSPGTGYCLEVWLSCGIEMQNADIRVKLYQKTIERLLSSCSNNKKHEKDEGYDPEMLLGRHIGSLVCVLQEVRKAKLLKTPSFKLLQLPY